MPRTAAAAPTASSLAQHSVTHIRCYSVTLSLSLSPITISSRCDHYLLSPVSISVSILPLLSLSLSTPVLLCEWVTPARRHGPYRALCAPKVWRLCAPSSCARYLLHGCVATIPVTITCRQRHSTHRVVLLSVPINTGRSACAPMCQPPPVSPLSILLWLG